METTLKYQEPSSKKRRVSDISEPNSPLKPSAKKKKLTCDGDKSEIQIVESSQTMQQNFETSLSDLVKNNIEFFHKIQDKQFKNNETYQQMMQQKMFGNRPHPGKINLEDPRILLLTQQFKPKAGHLFTHKRILDVGCHAGCVSLQIAAQFAPQIVIGIDIDQNLIKSAINNMHKMINEAETSEFIKAHTNDLDALMVANEREKQLNDLISKVKQMPKSLQLAIQGEIKILKDETRSQTISKSKELLYGRVNFRTENYIEQIGSKHVAQEQFDVVLCLSTVKWVHLCFGDVGVRALFLKAYEQLQSGGYFIIDQQPWKSYKKESHHKQQFKAVVMGGRIEFKPNNFKAHLKQLGFNLVHTITDLDKPIYIYQK